MENTRLEGFVFEQPKKPGSLKVLEVLSQRKHLNDDDQYELYKQRKGYEGEMRFAAYVRDVLPPDAQVVYSILLQQANSYFQIDCMILVRGQILLIDTKNLLGDYVYDQGDFLKIKRDKKINNPLHQLQRCQLLLGEFLERFQSQHKIQSYAVFIHPKFYLYNAPVGNTMIFHPQVERFLEKVKHTITHSPPKNENLPELFSAHHIKKNPQDYAPQYEYKELRKGVLCLGCSAKVKAWTRYRLICNQCGKMESIDSAVLRSALEYALLFPDKRLIPRDFHDWLEGIISVKRTLRILHKYLHPVGKHRALYFIFSKDRL